MSDLLAVEGVTDLLFVFGLILVAFLLCYGYGKSRNWDE